MFDELTTRFKSFGDAATAKLDAATSKLDFSTKLDFSFTTKVKATPNFKRVAEETISTEVQEERAAASKRADLILEQLDQSYFSAEFDPLRHELTTLADEANQDDVDAIVDKLSAAVEVVGNRLARHVVRNQDKLIEGITTVTLVEDDLKAACAAVQSSRSNLRMAGDDVAQQVKVVAFTRQKHSKMEVLEICSKIKKAKDLHLQLKHSQECGDYGEAILLCVECFQGLESLSALTVSAELKTVVQRLYYETLQRLDSALQNVCSSFTPEAYSKLLEGYLLQSTPGPALAAKVLAAFRESMRDSALRLVRSSVVITKPKLADALASSSLEGSYGELCRELPPDLVAPTLQKIMEVAFEVLKSYHYMAAWHAAAVAANASAKEGGAGSDDVAGGDGAGGQQMREASAQLLEAVNEQLQTGRVQVWEAAGAAVRDLLACPNLALRSDDYTLTIEWCQAFASVGEAFVGGRHPLRGVLVQLCGAALGPYHRSNYESLRACLSRESWQDTSEQQQRQQRSQEAAGSAGLEQLLRASPLYVAAHGEPGAAADFGDWVEQGNPFVPGAKHRVHSAAASSSSGAATPSSPRTSGGGASSSSQGPHNAASTSRMCTNSSRFVSKTLRAYASLMQPLSQQRHELWSHMTEFFDSYLLATFILFSGVTLETLVWQEDALPHRLRSALLRITTRDGCKYKAQVEELQRTKPAQPLLAGPPSAFLDTLGISTSSISTGGPSKFDAFTKKFKQGLEEFINADLSAPLPPQQQAHYQQQQMQQPPMQQGQLQPQQQQGLRAAGGAAANGARSADGASPRATRDYTGSPQPATAPVGGLKERVVAMESLIGLADELKAARAALIAALPQGMGREVEGYFARTVDATADLKEAVFMGAARQLLKGMVDPERGTAALIATTNYSMREPAESVRPWAEGLARHYRTFQEQVAASGLPQDMQRQMWDHAIKSGAEAMLDGLSRVRRCTLEGRAAMSLDLSHVEKGLRGVAPAQAMGGLRLVDTYIKAFYLPWEELARWAQIHLAEFGKAKIVLLIEAMADAHGVKRAQKMALLDKINAELAEFA